MMPDERSQQDIEMDEATLRLHSTDDAMVWAKEWVGIAAVLLARSNGNPLTLLDEGWMVGWFANAMGVAESFSRKRLFTEDELGALVEMTTALRDSSLSLIYPGVNTDELRIKLQNLDPVRFYT